MTKKTDLPAMPFYVGDWLKCPEVRALSPDVRGLWFDLLCYMWESTERGVMVKPNGKPYTQNEIIRIVGLDNQNSGIWLTYLLDNGVCSARETDGAIFSRRMVRDEEIRLIRRESGKRGGNPKLLDNQEDNQILNQSPNQITEDENEYIDSSNSSSKEREVIGEGVQFKTAGLKPEIKKDYFSILLDEFCFSYQSANGFEYQVLYPGKEKQALGKLQKLYKSENPTATTEQAIQDFRRTFDICNRIRDPWLKNNMSPTIIATKLNEIKQVLRNGNKQPTGKSGATDAELAEVVARHFGQK